VDDDRIIDIETKLAHQEYLLGELNDVLTEQASKISRLEELCRTLTDRLRALGDGSASGAGSPDDERPPHY
jgi:SlyX protein